MKIRLPAAVLATLIFLTAYVQASTPATTTAAPLQPTTTALTADEMATMQKLYIAPLAREAVIGRSWASASEVAPDDIIIALKMRDMRERGAYSYYLYEYDYLKYPVRYAESYAEKYFGMAAEQLRTSAFYDSNENAYFVPIATKDTLNITPTGGQRTGDRVEVAYNIADIHGTIEFQGTLSMEIGPDGSCRYLSNSCKQTVYTALRFPAAMNFILGEDRASMTSGGRVTLDTATPQSRTYDGTSLLNITGFYEAALKELGATGRVIPGKYPGGWAWAGTYDGGKPLTIDIQRTTTGSDYSIALTF